VLNCAGRITLVGGSPTASAAPADQGIYIDSKDTNIEKLKQPGMLDDML
jgi:hypothetical protein